MYSFSSAAITKQSLKQQKNCSFRVLEAGSSNSRGHQSFHSESSSKHVFGLFQVFGGDCQHFLAFLGLWIHHSYFCLYFHMTFPVCVSVSSHDFHIRTQDTRFRAHSDPVWPLFNFSDHICKGSNPNNMIFWGFWWTWIWRDPIQLDIQCNNLMLLQLARVNSVLWTLVIGMTSETPRHLWHGRIVLLVVSYSTFVVIDNCQARAPATWRKLHWRRASFI